MRSAVSDKTKGVIAGVTLAFIFSVIGVFARELDVGFTLYQQIYIRIGLAFLFAAFLFAPYVEWVKEPSLNAVLPVTREAAQDLEGGKVFYTSKHRY